MSDIGKARQSAFDILSRHGNCLADDVPMNELIEDIAEAIMKGPSGMTVSRQLAEARARRIAIPTCAVTGRIAGDRDACGDCDPCILGRSAVPGPVKKLLVERDELAQKYSDAMCELAEARAALRQIAIDCGKVMDDEVCSEAERRTWKALGRFALHAAALQTDEKP